METRSNLKLVIAVIGILFFGLILFAIFLSNSSASLNAIYNISFSKSVSGLSAGNAVTMSGVTVGRIKAISIDKENPGSILVTVALDEQVKIRDGVRADISRSFLNGDASLVLMPSSEGEIINPANTGGVGRIAASGGNKSSEPAQEAVQIARKLDDAVKGLDANGRAKIQASLAETAEKTAAWQASAARIADALTTVKVKRISSRIADAGRSVDRLNSSIESSDEKVSKVRSGIREVGAGADGAARSINELRPSVRAATQDLQKTSESIKDIRGGVSNTSETIKEALPEQR